MLGLSFTARYPVDVSALVLVGCGTYDESSRARYRRSLELRLGDAGRRRIAALESRLTPEPNVANRDAILGELGAAHMEAESYELLDMSDESAKSLPPDEAGHLETWNDVLRLQRERIEPDAFKAVKARVLMIHGAADPHPGEATRDLLRQFIPQLEYLELDRCGHAPWRELHAHDRFIQSVREWLRQT